MVARLPVKEMVAGSNPARGARQDERSSLAGSFILAASNDLDMKGWLKQNWFKLFLAVVISALSLMAFFAIYPAAFEGYQLFKAYPPGDLVFPKKSGDHFEVVDPFKQ